MDLSGQGGLTRYQPTRVLVQGKLRSGKGYNRGRTVLHTEEEWRDRFQALLDQRMRYLYVLFGAMGAFLVLFTLYLGITAEGPWFAAMVLMMTLAVVFLVQIPVIVYVAKRIMRKLPAPGLYEGGLQLTPYLFIPYPEIASTERLPASGLRREGLRLRLAERPSWRLRMNLPSPITIAVDFLGEDGVMELESRVYGMPWPRERPKLVLYGP